MAGPEALPVLPGKGRTGRHMQADQPEEDA